MHIQTIASPIISILIHVNPDPRLAAPVPVASTSTMDAMCHLCVSPAHPYDAAHKESKTNPVQSHGAIVNVLMTGPPHTRPARSEERVVIVLARHCPRPGSVCRKRVLKARESRAQRDGREDEKEQRAENHAAEEGRQPAPAASGWPCTHRCGGIRPCVFC